MLRFTRKTEYALLAIEHMIRKEHQKDCVTSAREVADAHHIPLPLLAKVLQQLAVKGLVKSVQGTKGGYVLAKRPMDISVADIAEVFEGPLAVAECFKDEKITCPQWNGCLIKDPFYELNQKIYHLLVQTTVADLAHRPERPTVQENL
jgi:Rrf2 family protein